jgi:hypothetical protein
MRWLFIRKANIPEQERNTFERFGVPVVGFALASSFHTAAPELHLVYDNPETRNHAADWLTEQYDRAERKESWLITMEVAITLFVALELLLSILNFCNVS